MYKTQFRLQHLSGTLGAHNSTDPLALKVDNALQNSTSVAAIDVQDVNDLLQEYGRALSRINGKSDWFNQNAGQMDQANTQINVDGGATLQFSNLDTSIGAGDDIGTIKFKTEDSEAAAAGNFAQIKVESLNEITEVADAVATFTVKLASAAAAADKLVLRGDGILQVDKLQKLGANDIAIKSDTNLRFEDADGDNYAAFSFGTADAENRNCRYKLPANSTTAAAGMVLAIQANNTIDGSNRELQLQWLDVKETRQKRFIQIAANDKITAGREVRIQGNMQDEWNLSALSNLGTDTFKTTGTNSQYMDIYHNGILLRPSSTGLPAKGTLDFPFRTAAAATADHQVLLTGGSASGYLITPGSHIKISAKGVDKTTDSATFVYVDRPNSIAKADATNKRSALNVAGSKFSNSGCKSVDSIQANGGNAWPASQTYNVEAGQNGVTTQSSGVGAKYQIVTAANGMSATVTVIQPGKGFVVNETITVPNSAIGNNAGGGNLLFDVESLCGVIEYANGDHKNIFDKIKDNDIIEFVGGSASNFGTGGSDVGLVELRLYRAFRSVIQGSNDGYLHLCNFNQTAAVAQTLEFGANQPDANDTRIEWCALRADGAQKIADGDCLAGVDSSGADTTWVRTDQTATRTSRAGRFLVKSGQYGVDASNTNGDRLNIKCDDIINGYPVDIGATQFAALENLAAEIDPFLGDPDADYKASVANEGGAAVRMTIQAKGCWATGGGGAFDSMFNDWGAARSSNTGHDRPLSLRTANGSAGNSSLADVSFASSTGGHDGQDLDYDYGQGASSAEHVVFNFDIDLDDNVSIIYRKS
tara:strand:+ start:3760 stop:6213 length:2454 start_codon:yes stop_codon:yes gene_type:complete